jgi:1,4-dihydroxy-2-naphthoate octaprenyltransferase
VFTFFGLVATAGSAYVQAARLSGVALAAAVPVGLLSTALLVVNNLRDIDGDARSGKRTLAVRIGDGPTRAMYIALVCIAFALLPLIALWRPYAVLALLAVPLAVRPLRVVATATGPALVPVLMSTARLLLVAGALLAVGLALSG